MRRAGALVLATSSFGVLVVAAAVGFVACSSDSSTTDASSMDAGSKARPCFQFTKEKLCICEDTSVEDGGSFFPVADCTPESQGTGSLCCSSDTACSCAAPFEVRCIKGSLGNCKCIPDVRMDDVDEGQPRVDKCTPASTDGGLQFHCCKSNDGTLSWPSCRCSLLACDTKQTEVTECLPETVPSACDQDKNQVPTCKP